MQETDFGEVLAATAFTLARRFAHGATLWCVAPEWPEHARHVAVEFVHPVIVGKRALPAVSVDGSDPAKALRSLARAGDCLLALGPASSPMIASMLRRAPAWGATTMWIGAGERPPGAAADHMLWVDGDAATARYDGRLVLLYHVLWELAHVCFEHPGVLDHPPPTVCVTTTETCVTCSDEGRLGDVITSDGAGHAQVRTAQGIEMIDTTIVDDLGPGDVVLIHAGAAIAVVP